MPPTAQPTHAGTMPLSRATLTGGLNPADPLAGELDSAYLLRRRALLRSIASRARCSSAPQLPVLARRRSAWRVRSERFASRRSALAIFCRRLWFGSGTTCKSPQIRKDGAYASCGCFGRDTGSIGATIENRLMTRGVPDAASNNGFPIYILPSSPRSGSWLTTPSRNCRPGG